MDYDLRMKLYERVYRDLTKRESEKVSELKIPATPQRNPKKQPTVTQPKVADQPMAVDPSGKQRIERSSSTLREIGNRSKISKEKKPLSEYQKFVKEESKKKEYEGIKGKSLLVKIAKRWKTVKAEKTRKTDG